MERLLFSNGCDGLFVVVDCLTKYAHFIAMVHLYMTKTIVNLYVDYMMELHDNPRSIVIDRDYLFMSNSW